MHLAVVYCIMCLIVFMPYLLVLTILLISVVFLLFFSIIVFELAEAFMPAPFLSEYVTGMLGSEGGWWVGV